MKFKILVSLLLLTSARGILCEQQVVAHAMTHEEQQVVVVNDLLNDLKMIARNVASVDSKEYGNYLFNKYGAISEFRFLCSFLDVMHKECHGKIVINDNQTDINDALQALKDVMVNNKSSNAVAFIKLYQQARHTYKTHMNCPEFAQLFNVFIKINELQELKNDQCQTDESIKRFKRIALGALAAFAEGAANTLVE